MIIPQNLCRMLVCSGRRGRRPPQKIMTYAMFCCRGGRPRPPVKCSTHFAIFRKICAVYWCARDVEVADCRWQSFCDLTESADESRPLQKIMTYAMFCCRGGRPRPPVQITKRLPESADESRPLHRQRSLCLLEFYHDKIHRLRCGVSSSQKISGTTLIFRDPCFIKIKIIFPSPPR